MSQEEYIEIFLKNAIDVINQLDRQQILSIIQSNDLAFTRFQSRTTKK